MIKIIWEQAEKLANVFKRINIEIDPLTDPQLYPSTDDDREHILRYFLVMVAMDHRTQIPGYVFSSKIGEKEFSGAFLLYKLGKAMYDNDRTFFSPEKLIKITKRDIEKWLTSDTGIVRDPEIRASLLRDLGYKLIKIYEGNVENLINQSNYKLKDMNGCGFIDRLKIFRAYEDPVEKKSYLLAKFLIRRNLFHPTDLHNLQLPIDNHLTRIAVRTGLIESDDQTLFTNMREATYEEDIIIRLQARRAYKKISELSNHTPDKLDDYLWMHGKYVCTQQNPKCDSCTLQDVCLAYEDTKRRKLQEHKYINTWYY